MTEVENVSAAATGFAEDAASLTLYRLPRREQQRRIKIALDALVVADPLPRLAERQAPIDADDIGIRIADVLQQLDRARAEVNRGNLAPKRIEDPRRV